MSFPSAGGTVQDDLSSAWSSARSAANQIKKKAQELRTASAAGPVQVGMILAFASDVATARIQLARSAGTSGIGPYAQAQIVDPVINVASEFAAMMAQIDASIAWIIANFPKDGGGFLLAMTWTPDNSGFTQYRSLTTAQLAGLRTILDALIVVID